ncbi:9345_t:CDS:2 [Entrophospora sp. SA101]|nr:9345_t:CDS:2 [Entrophospora sp. SA101]
MSLREFIDKTLANHLKRDDFYVKECKKCKGNNKNKCTIWKYDPFELSDGDGLHKNHLCARCQHKEYCSQSGTYFVLLHSFSKFN